MQAPERFGVVVRARLDQVEVGLDDLQDVVEVVRHAAGELADRLHLLALPKRRVVAQLLGHVDAAHHGAAARHLAARDLVVAALVGDARRGLRLLLRLTEAQGLQQRPGRRKTLR